MPQRLLFKYCDENGVKILENGSFIVKSPSQFNDPFEFRPPFDEQRKNRYFRDHNRFSEYTGMGPSFPEGETKVEQFIDFETHANAKQLLDNSYRILCLTEDRGNATMWYHYCQNHTGVVIGFDANHPNFCQGVHEGGVEIAYSDDRTQCLLPEAFYSFPPLLDAYGQVMTPNGEIENEGLILTRKQVVDMVERQLLKSMRTKSTTWVYEKEIRFIYDLRKNGKHLKPLNNHSLVSVPPDAVTHIIFGMNTPLEKLDEVEAYVAGRRYPNIMYCFTTFHPYLYRIEVQGLNSLQNLREFLTDRQSMRYEE